MDHVVVAAHCREQIFDNIIHDGPTKNDEISQVQEFFPSKAGRYISSRFTYTKDSKYCSQNEWSPGRKTLKYMKWNQHLRDEEETPVSDKEKIG